MRTMTLKNIKTKIKRPVDELTPGANFLTWKWYREELAQNEGDSQKERGMWMAREWQGYMVRISDIGVTGVPKGEEREYKT